jgi:hypothetical protein
MDDADFAADLAERERAALLARHKARLPPPIAPKRGAVFGAADRRADESREKA